MAEDLSEVHDLAAESPRQGGRAGRAVVGGGAAQRRAAPRQPGPRGHRPPQARPPAPADTFRYFQGGAQVPEPVAVDVLQPLPRASRVTIEVPDGVVPNGVLLALGCALGGWSLHLLDGRLRYVHNLYGRKRHVVQAEALLGPGRHTVHSASTQTERRWLGQPSRRREWWPRA